MVTGSFALLVAPGSVLDALFDDTFAGIHQLAWFDWAILIPYFAVLAILSVYGLHRYEIIRDLLQAPQEAVPKEPPSNSSNCRASPSSFLSTTSATWSNG